MKKLKQKKDEIFCLEYIKDFNGARSAIEAGYAEKSARVTASRLLTNANILARIKELITERAQRLCLTSDNIVLRLADVYEKCMQEKPVMEFDFVEKKMVKTGEYVFDSKGALKAAELLGKHIGMFTDKLDLNCPVSIVVKSDYGDNS